MSETAVYAFEQLEPSEVQPRDALARMLARAAEEAERVREQARTEGFEEGLRTGREQGAHEVSSAVRALEQALAGVGTLRDGTVEAVERDAIDLALELSGKILGGALRQVRSETVIEVVQGALRRAGDRRKIVVLVNPGDLQTVKLTLGVPAGLGSGVELCDVQADERVQPGGAIVRTAEGEVDASVPTQLERAREVVEASLAGGESPA